MLFEELVVKLGEMLHLRGVYNSGRTELEYTVSASLKVREVGRIQPVSRAERCRRVKLSPIKNKRR